MRFNVRFTREQFARAIDGALDTRDYHVRPASQINARANPARLNDVVNETAIPLTKRCRF